MIWNSLFWTTLFDLAICGVVLWSLLLFWRRRHRLPEKETRTGQWLVVAGLSCLGLFYLTDILILYGLPLWQGRQRSIALMEQLHLNYSLAVDLVSVLCLFCGFYLITRQLVRLVDRQRTDEALQRQAGTLKDAENSVRLAVASMDRPEDICRVVEQIGHQLQALGLAHASVSIQVVNTPAAGFVSFGHFVPRAWDEILAWFAGSPWPEAEENARRHPWVSEVWRSQKPHYQPSLDLECPNGAVLRGLSLIDVPFSHGTLGVHRTQDIAFAPEDIKLVEAFAGVLSMGFQRFLDLLERSRAQQRERVAHSVQRVRNQVLRMRDTTDWSAIGRCLVDELRPLVPTEDISIVVQTPEGSGLISYYFYGVSGMHQHAENAKSSFDRATALREAIDSGRPVYRRNRRQMARYHDRIAAKINSVVDLPFDRGCLGINSTEEEAFSAADLAILGEMAVVMGEAYRRLQDLHRIRRQEEQLLQAQKLEAVGQLAAGTAHNFNNMLQAILSNLYMIEEQAGGAVASMASTAITAGERSATMIRQLLVFSHRDIAQPFRRVDPAAVAEAVLAICRQSFPRNIPLTLESSTRHAFFGDAGQMEQLLLNLCINARDALVQGATEAPHIVLRIKEAYGVLTDDPNDACLCFEISDNGPGMDEDTRRRVFEPFFTTKPVGQGTGLGLAMAYGVVERHQGRIECSSSPDAGATFSIYLPCA